MTRIPSPPDAGARGGLATVPAKVRRLRAEAGTSGLVVRLLERIPARLVYTQWYGVFESHPRPGMPLPDTAATGTVRWAESADAPALGLLQRGEETVRARMARGDVAALTEVDGRVVAHVFFHRGDYDESNVVFTLAADERWIYDGLVAPDMRGRRIHPRMLRWAVDDLARAGVVRTVSTIDHLNTASLRAAGARGARLIGSVLSVTSLGVTVSSVRWVGGRRRWRVHRAPRRVTPPV